MQDSKTSSSLELRLRLSPKQCLDWKALTNLPIQRNLAGRRINDWLDNLSHGDRGVEDGEEQDAGEDRDHAAVELTERP